MNSLVENDALFISASTAETPGGGDFLLESRELEFKNINDAAGGVLITTFHGLVRIYNSNGWPSRLFWIVITFVAMALFFVQVWRKALFLAT